MAVVGNLALLLDVTSPLTITTIDRRTRILPSDVVLHLFKKDITQSNPNTSLRPIEFEKDANSSRNGVVRGAKERTSSRGKKASSRRNGVDYESSSDDDVNGIEDEEEEESEESEGRFDWEKVMRNRVREIEEMRELEKKAEELQGRVGGDGGGGGNNGGEETEEQKRMRVKRELEKVAQEQAERRKMAQLMFDLGQKAYGRGMYGRAIEFLEAALTIIPRPTLFGGEIQIWLAMAYEANNRHSDCITLYKQLENSHPVISIRRQASELRYILQAPKLKISQEEMVTIPLIGSSYDNYAGTWSDKYKDRDETRSGSTTNQLPSNRDYLGDFMVWRPPVGLDKNQAFWAALALWLGLVAAALFIQ